MTSVVVNLGILGVFKYFNFFADNAARLLGSLGVHASYSVLYIVLPVGISFYTFQTLGYTIDVFNRRIPAVRNPLDFALYVAYFPQLVAGPIERASHLIPALRKDRRVTREMISSGLTLILIGLFRKVVIADGLAQQIDPVFASPSSYSSPVLLKAVYLFALQIYCDFAGYSDIARGSSRLLGIELMVNFNHPYFATNVSDFWHRWHISLSTWLRDYLYIPLGGNRHGKFKTYRNLMLTMLLGGLWHGAAWCFVAWGGLHGAYLAVSRFFSRILLQSEIEDLPLWSGRRIVAMILTFHLVLFTWVFFRSPGLLSALNFLRLIFSFRGMDEWAQVLPLVLVPWVLVLLIDVPQHLSGHHEILQRVPNFVRQTATAAMLAAILLGLGTHAPFIYFQF